MDEEHEKPKIATAAGFLEFFDMEAAQIELLAALLEDVHQRGALLLLACHFLDTS